MQNIYLGREVIAPGLRGRLGFLDGRAMLERTQASFRELGVSVPGIRSAVANFSGGQRQGVAVARALMWARCVVFMDARTAALGVAQTRNVPSPIRKVSERGAFVVLISHSMPDVMAVAGRIVVLRQRRTVARVRAGEVRSDDLAAAMTGSLKIEGAPA